MSLTMGTRIAGQGSKWLRRSTRMSLYVRDGWCCVYCGAASDDGAALTIDHVRPCELGGDNDPSNLVTACLSCNSAKRDLPMRAWFARLRDQGVDTSQIALRIRRQMARKLDRSEGRRLAALRGGRS